MAAILICTLLVVGAVSIVAIVFYVRRKRREKQVPVSNAIVNTCKLLNKCTHTQRSENYTDLNLATMSAHNTIPSFR